MDIFPFALLFQTSNGSAAFLAIEAVKLLASEINNEVKQKAEQNNQ